MKIPSWLALIVWITGLVALWFLFAFIRKILDKAARRGLEDLANGQLSETGD